MRIIPYWRGGRINKRKITKSERRKKRTSDGERNYEKQNVKKDDSAEIRTSTPVGMVVRAGCQEALRRVHYGDVRAQRKPVLCDLVKRVGDWHLRISGSSYL
jgi:hypothetical protein